MYVCQNGGVNPPQKPTSTKTRIKTKYILIDYISSLIAQKPTSTKTRIKTPHLPDDKTQINTLKNQLPQKQGLRPTNAKQSIGFIFLKNQLPQKQGLRLRYRIRCN